MKVYSGDAIAMRFEHGFDRRRIGNIGRAFVVDYQVIGFGVIRITQDCQRRMSAGVIGVNLVDDDVCALFYPSFEDIFLTSIIMAATAGDEQNS